MLTFVSGTLEQLEPSYYKHQLPWQKMLSSKPQYQPLIVKPVQAINLYNKQSAVNAKEKQMVKAEPMMVVTEEKVVPTQTTVLRPEPAAPAVQQEKKQQQQAKKQGKKKQPQPVVSRVLLKPPRDNLKKRKTAMKELRKRK